jgi:Putative zinc-finger
MKSECSEYQKKIAGSFLEDLTDTERQSLEEHLAACSACRSEQAGYAAALELLRSAGDEPVPHHFFVHQEEWVPNPWHLFCRMKPVWRAATAAVLAAFLLMGVAAVSRLQIRFGSDGWKISFGGTDVEALKKDILRAAEAQSRESMNARIQQVQAEIMQSHTTALQQRDYLEAELSRLDSRIGRRVEMAEGRVRADTQGMVFDVYQAVSRQRAQDLGIMNLRFDAIEANNAIKTRQTNDILGTLLQVAELRLGQNGGQK